MKPTLQLRVGTQLTMTPQLQQAIQLLQLSTLDLRQEIQQALDANPMLELEEHFDEREVSETQDDDWSSEIPEDLPLDSDWSDTYQDAGLGSLNGSGGSEEAAAASDVSSAEEAHGGSSAARSERVKSPAAISEVESI